MLSVFVTFDFGFYKFKKIAWNDLWINVIKFLVFVVIDACIFLIGKQMVNRISCERLPSVQNTFFVKLCNN